MQCKTQDNCLVLEAGNAGGSSFGFCHVLLVLLMLCDTPRPLVVLGRIVVYMAAREIG